MIKVFENFLNKKYNNEIYDLHTDLEFPWFHSPHTDKKSALDKIQSNVNEYYFHAGTTKKENKIYASGGRVLNFVCLSENFLDARKKVINSINSLNWNKGFYRKDIGHKVINE